VTSEKPSTRAPIALVLLGFAAGISQALLLREAMGAMGGSELAWGTVMALWLVGMAIGSRAGTTAGRFDTASWLPLAVVALAGLGVTLFRAAPALLGAAPGETITTWQAMGLWLAAVVPPAIAGGLAFPILADGLGSQRAGAGYGLEAAGALIGGIALSLVLAPSGTVAALCLTAAIVVVCGPPAGRRLAKLVVAVGLVVVSPHAGDLVARAGWDWSGHPGELDRWAETRRQRIELSSGPPHSLYSDGRLVASHPDPYNANPSGHLAMLLHPEPRRVLAVGALVDGTAQAMARHPVEMLVIVEDDPALVRRLPAWFGIDVETVFPPSRTAILAADPIRTLSGSEPFDLIVLRDSDPITIRLNRTRTVEFFRLCSSRLADDGVLALRLGLSDTYLGGSAGRLLELMVSTLTSVFPQVVAIPGEQVTLVAGRAGARLTIDPEVLAKRWIDRSVSDPVFTPDWLELLVDPNRATDLARSIEAADTPVNSRRHPRAVILAAGLVEAKSHHFMLHLSRRLETHRPTPLVIGLTIASLVLIANGLRRDPTPIATGAVVGATSMGWWLLLMAAWQSTLGSVYAEVGALNAAFMAGLAAGAIWADRVVRPARLVPWLLLAGCAVSCVLGSDAVLMTPLVTIPLLLVVGGLLTGAAFAGVAETAGRGQTRRGSGLAFAADEAGAAVSALVVGIVALPWAGSTATALGLAIVGLAAIPAAIRTTRPGP
jgi:spermidine synthase